MRSNPFLWPKKCKYWYLYQHTLQYPLFILRILLICISMPSAWYLTSFISIPLLFSIPLTHPLFHLTRPISLPSLLIPSIPPQNIPSHGAKIAKAMTQCTFLFNRNSAEQLIIHSIYLITHSIYLITHICKNTYISMPQHFHAFIRSTPFFVRTALN